MRMTRMSYIVLPESRVRYCSGIRNRTIRLVQLYRAAFIMNLSPGFFKLQVRNMRGSSKELESCRFLLGLRIITEIN
jgi:hypothetical protein